MSKLELRNIKLDSYPNRKIKSLSIDNLKKINVVLGQNGSGKSTLCSAIKGIIWRERLKRGHESKETYGSIKGEATLDGQKVIFDTNVEKHSVEVVEDE